MVSSALALASVLTIGAPSVGPIAALSVSSLRPRPELALRLVVRGPGAGEPLVLGEAAPRRARAADGGPVCSGDVCQPAVEVPGYAASYGRAHRSEAFVALLTRAHVEPLATLAWALVATGLRFDYSPPAFDGPNAGARGWGSVMLRLRLRLDANGHAAIPARPR